MRERQIHELLALRDDCMLRLEVLRAQALATDAAAGFPPQLHGEIDAVAHQLDAVCATMRTAFPAYHPKSTKRHERTVDRGDAPSIQDVGYG